MEVSRTLTLSRKFWVVVYSDGTRKGIAVKKGDNIKPFIRPYPKSR